METKYYTVERGQQILVSLLKQHGIRKVIASPGTTNITFVASVMNDPFFEIYSSVDERSAAYMAVGMAEETGEVVVLSCTGATASRNYIPGLTEAYYRKLPILAVTATQNENRVGHLIPQVIDRSQQPKDCCVHSEHIAVPRDVDDEWDATIRLNRAILALTHRGGGPVHINLATNYNRDFSVKELPVARCIRRYMSSDELPVLSTGRIAILVGNHLPWSASLTEAVNRFCKAYGAVVFCEHASNYSGPYRVYNAILNQQSYCKKESFRTDVLIHIGEVSGYGNNVAGIKAGEVWRVNEDGELRDPFHKLTQVFEMAEEVFFNRYADLVGERNEQQKAGKAWLEQCHAEYQKLQAAIPELPFSNIWIAQQTAHRLPEGCVLHLGILNSLRAWEMFDVPASVQSNGFVNTGGFGIDGCMSSMIGGAIARPDQLHFLVIGDLAFFYDLNSLGNRHVGNNLRILLVNNGKGTEFRNYNHPAAQFGEDADKYMAAAGHYGNKSLQLVRHYAEDLGYEYMKASDKEEYLINIDRFLMSDITDKPMLFEVFTNNEDESSALKLMNTLIEDLSFNFRKTVRTVIPNFIKNVLK
ncbi:thiamine pyrophosphate-binding protein [Bacteroides ndongoniae]|uniref:thiamine pyrophosphate-binding protein n=1 Tax=Bacteroides ndongoniae TaxID=1903262 RepID=UPI0008D9843E|nr:thiamine pyrophosphate-binding protein [Bacteroides ndongoniae]